MRFKGDHQAPAEPAPGEGAEGNSTAGSCQLSAAIKGEGPAEFPAATLFYLWAAKASNSAANAFLEDVNLFKPK